MTDALMRQWSNLHRTKQTDHDLEIEDKRQILLGASQIRSHRNTLTKFCSRIENHSPKLSQSSFSSHFS